ncbi:MAG: DExD/H-box ATP-dependent RNA helicase dhh1 [Sporothrix thermara]
MHTRPVQDEDGPGLVFVQNNCVGEPVRIILSRLASDAGQQQQLLQVRFATTASSLRDSTDGMQDTLERDARAPHRSAYRADRGNQKKFQHYAELLSTAAVTQTYHYMVEAGLEYGYLTKGDAVVFLKMYWDRDPTVLLLHYLARPLREVAVNEDPVYSNARMALLQEQLEECLGTVDLRSLRQVYF